MPSSLLRTIHSLAKYEHFKKCKVCDEGEEYELPLLTYFLSVWNSLELSEKACELVLAADRLIGYLLSYREEITIGHRYFQPVFYPRRKKVFVWFSWDSQNREKFCNGCSEEACPHERFSSGCPRFRIAWAIEHITAATNRLVSLAERRQHAKAVMDSGM